MGRYLVKGDVPDAAVADPTIGARLALRAMRVLQFMQTRNLVAYPQYPEASSSRHILPICVHDIVTEKADLLLLVDDDAPFVLLVAVHNVVHEALDLGRVDAAVAVGHGDLDVGSAVVDLGDGADEVLKVI
jgi:hypothetical protein